MRRPLVKRSLATAFSLALLLLSAVGCDGAPAAPAGSADPAVSSAPPAADPAPSPTQSGPPVETAAYRLVFPADRVFTCAASWSSEEEPFPFSKDQVENGWVWYEKSLVPFSDHLLDHPDASLLMWTGVHECMLESWEIGLNDGWVCYLYRGERDHATAVFDPGGTGTAYSAMIGRPGDEHVFCLAWQNYVETDLEEPLESFQEGDPGYVSTEDMRSFLSGITVERDAG